MQEALPHTYYVIARKKDRFLEADQLNQMKFLTGVPGPGSPYQFTGGIPEGMPLIFSDLPELAERFLWGATDGKRVYSFRKHRVHGTS